MLVGEVFWGIINDEKKIKREGRNTIRTNVRQGATRWTKLKPEHMNINLRPSVSSSRFSSVPCDLWINNSEISET